LCGWAFWQQKCSLGKDWLVMKEARVENIVVELKETVARLNRLNDILNKTGTTFYLHRSTNDGPFTLSNIEQRVEY
jgi:hypothetical protein